MTTRRDLDRIRFPTSNFARFSSTLPAGYDPGNERSPLLKYHQISDSWTCSRQENYIHFLSKTMISDFLFVKYLLNFFYRNVRFFHITAYYIENFSNDFRCRKSCVSLSVCVQCGSAYVQKIFLTRKLFACLLPKCLNYGK